MKTKLLFLALFTLASCSKNKPTENQSQNPSRPSSPSNISSQQAQAPFSMLVIDEFGTPVPQASILIGQEPHLDFENNLLHTDDSGQVTAPPSWTSPLPVTVFKEGYIYQTHVSMIPSSHTFQIQKVLSESSYTKSGKILGFENLKKDGFIDFGLTMPTFSKTNSLDLELSKMISPELESLSVLGYELLVPSNIFLPKQTESYGLFSFSIEKAFFKMLFNISGIHKISANRGRFDFKKVADKMKAGKSYFEVVNDFQFLSYDIHNITTHDNTQSSLSTSHLLTQKIEFLSPISVPSNRLLYGIALIENEQDFSVVDIKLKDSQRQYLSYPTSVQPKMILANAGYEKINKDVGKISDSLSTGIYNQEKLPTSQLLDLIEKPKPISFGITAIPPKLKKNLAANSTKITLSEVESQTTPNFYLERKKILWEIYASGWISQVELPQILNRDTKKFKRWDVIYYANEEGETHATHMVRNAVDFIQ